MPTSNTRLSSPFDEGDETQGSLHGYGSPSEQQPANDLALTTFHAHSSSTSVPPSNLLSGAPQASSSMTPDLHHQHLDFDQYSLQLNQAMLTTFPMRDRKALPSVHSQFYGGPVRSLPFSAPIMDQGGWLYGQQVPPVRPGVYQTDGSHIPDANGTASKPVWTELHTQILEAYKRLGKTVPEIAEALHNLDGKTWTTNCITKRWARLREKCVPKHVSSTTTTTTTTGSSSSSIH